MLCPPVPTEPFREVIWHYMNTLCTTQKQTSLTTSLLEDMSVFNGHDATKLEYWLMDIETAADLTDESRAKLAMMKSRGLTNTLIMDVITLNNSWHDIKDIFRLKLCSNDIHTYTLCFMEIQKQENEFLAAYIYHFKMEAKRCNFTNNAATIRIFIKGLRNAHSLATHI